MSRCQTRCHDLDSINNYLFSEPSAYDPIGYVLHQLALLLAIDPHPAKEKSIGLSIRQFINQSIIIQLCFCAHFPLSF